MISRYLGRNLILYTSIVMTVLLVIYFFTTLATELTDVGRGTYTMGDAMLYSIMLIPRQVYELFPMVALLGTMLGLGALASSSELIVLRAAGLSVANIVVKILRTGAVMVLLVVIVGEVIAPPLELKARVHRGNALMKMVTVNPLSGLWAREGSYFINFHRFLPNGEVSGVSIYRIGQDGRLEQITEASHGINQGDKWLLKKVQHTLFSEQGLSSTTEKSMHWQSSLNKEVLDLIMIPPETLSGIELYEYINYLQQNGLESRQYELSLWTRIMAPLAMASMVLLAIPFVFGSLRGVSVGQRIVVGALLGIGFYLFNAVFGRVAVLYEYSPMMSAMVPTVVVFLGWMVLMRRVR